MERFSVKLGLILGCIMSLSVVHADSNKDNDGQDESDGCLRLHGHISTQISSAGCNSPYGVCTVGSTVGSGLISGQTSYTALHLGPDALDNTFQKSFSYSGYLSIQTKHGIISMTDLGLLDNVGGLFTEFSTDLSGTGLFEGAKGHFFFFGLATGTGFDGKIQGEVCLANRANAQK